MRDANCAIRDDLGTLKPPEVVSLYRNSHSAIRTALLQVHLPQQRLESRVRAERLTCLA